MSDTPKSSNIHNSFITGFLGTLKSIFTDVGVLLMLVIAPVIYGFFYPWPYQKEVLNDVPVGVLDYDHSELSDTIIRFSDASPRLQVVQYTDENAVKEAIWTGKINGYLVIPNGLEQKVMAGKQAEVVVLGNGGYFLLNKQVQTGFTESIGTVSAGIEIKKNVARGAYANTAKSNTQAVPLRIDPLFNPYEGYGSYVVPGVSILILQQTLLMGTALLLGTWAERRLQFASVMGWVGRISALSVISFLVACFYYGCVFSIQGYSRGHNMKTTLAFFALFAPTVATLGCIFGMWFRERERSMQILIFSSLPIFFVSGYPWPVSQLPETLQYIRWIIPTSSGINASVQINQMGASFSQVSHYFFNLAVLLVGFFIILILMQQGQLRRLSRDSSL